MVVSNIPTPMPMRVLSCTLAGCRNSHTASTNMMTGNAYATRPKSPPKVYESSATATPSLGRNHSTIAPAIASSRMRKGTPSRRSSLASVSLPSSRAAPPKTCARPIHAVVSSPGSFGGGVLATGSRFVGALRAGVARELVVVVRERDDVPRVLVAMCPRYLRPPAQAG